MLVGARLRVSVYVVLASDAHVVVALSHGFARPSNVTTLSKPLPKMFLPLPAEVRNFRQSDWVDFAIVHVFLLVFVFGAALLAGYMVSERMAGF